MNINWRQITVVQIANGLSAFVSDDISLLAFRLYLGCFELKAKREVAARVRQKKQTHGRTSTDRYNRFQIDELMKLCGERCRGKVKRELEELQKARLVHWSEEEIILPETIVSADAKALVDDIAGSRSPTRRIPFPRRLIRYLMRCKKVRAGTLILHSVRGVSWVQRQIQACGTIKASWIAAILRCSERAVYRARQQLRHDGIISEDTTIQQWKLNRDGCYFAVNMLWRKEHIGTVYVPGKHEGSTANDSSEIVENFLPQFTSAAQKVSGPPPKKSQKVSGPIREAITTTVSRYQVTRTKSERTGVCKQTFSGEEAKANIADIKPEDLESFSATEELYREAVKDGLIDGSEASALNFLAAAVRAKTTKARDPVRVFVSLIKRRLWHHITSEQEERARRALARYREENPNRFRVAA